MVRSKIFILKNAYLYPVSARFKKEHHNPYLESFMNSVEEDFVFLNRNSPSNKGLFDIFKYLRKIDYVFFHWAENICERKFGLMQTFLLFILLPVLKLKRVNIIYTVHNKVSHTNNHYKLKKLISKTLIKYSTCIITHAKDGIPFINSLVKKKNNIVFFPHPVMDERPFPDVKKDIDVLIWGSIAPYKGIHNFLEQIAKKDFSEKWKIVIAGKISSKAYSQKILSIINPNVKIIDEYIEEDQLKELIARSKIVLFPYHADTILSSGAFAKTIIFPAHIIGPRCGSFSDFDDFEHVDTFSDEKEMINLIESRLSETNYLNKDFSSKLLNLYSWEKFGFTLSSNLLENNN